MSLEETASYIDHGLEVAHRKEKLFSVACRSPEVPQVNLRNFPSFTRGNAVCHVEEIAGGKLRKLLLAGDSTTTLQNSEERLHGVETRQDVASAALGAFLPTVRYAPVVSEVA